MELRDLQIFCDLVETMSFSQTAKRHYLSQSAISQRLRVVERSMGCVLLHRGKGRMQMKLTEAGRLFYESARCILREVETLEERLKDLTDNSITGVVRIATVYSVGLHELPARLKPFLREHPQVSVHLEYYPTDAIYRNVYSGEADIGIVAVPAEYLGVDVLPLCDEPMALICPPEHPLAKEECVPLTALEGQSFIAFGMDIPTRRLVDEHLRLAGVRVRIVNTCDNIEMIKNLIELGQGISLLPEIAARKEVREGTLAAVPLAPQDAFRRPVGLILRRMGPRRAVVRALVAALLSRPSLEDLPMEVAKEEAEGLRG